jgi:hypothetical protein
MESAQWIASIIGLTTTPDVQLSLQQGNNAVALKTNGPAKYAGPSQRAAKKHQIG